MPYRAYDDNVNMFRNRDSQQLNARWPNSYPQSKNVPGQMINPSKQRSQIPHNINEPQGEIVRPDLNADEMTEGLDFDMGDPINDVIAEVGEQETNEVNSPNVSSANSNFVSQAIQQARNIGRSAYGNPQDKFSEEEQQELEEKRERAMELKSEIRQPGKQGSYRIRGNPYSLDTRGLYTSVANLVADRINDPRREELSEAQSRVGTLESDQESAKRAEQNIASLVSEYVPMRQQQQFESQENKEQREYDREQEEKGRELRRDIQRLDRQLQRDLAEQDRNSRGGQQNYSVSATRDMVDYLYPDIRKYRNLIEAERARINSDNALPEDVEDAKENIKEYREKLIPKLKDAGEYVRQSGLVPPIPKDSDDGDGGGNGGENNGEGGFWNSYWGSRNRGQQTQPPYQRGQQSANQSGQPNQNQQEDLPEITNKADFDTLDNNSRFIRGGKVYEKRNGKIVGPINE